MEPEGPDGGWGWVVVLASFMCLCVLDGAAYTFGVFIDPLIEEMGGGRGQTSVAGKGYFLWYLLVFICYKYKCQGANKISDSSMSSSKFHSVFIKEKLDINKV